MTVKRYFARSELSANWFDIVDPKVVLSLKPVAIDETKFLPDRQAVKKAFKEFGKVSKVHASTISEVSVYEKRDGVSADSHPKNSEDGNKTPFTDNKIAHFLSYVNWTRATKLAWSACICFAMGVLSSGVIASVFELVAAVFFLASTYYSVRLAVLSWRLRRFGLTILALAILSLSLGAVLA